MRMDVNMDYSDLEGYQRTLLSLVELQEYDDKVVERLSLILEEVKGVEEVERAIHRLQSLSGMDDAWPLLFSYDNLKLTYAALRKWHKTGKCPEIQVE